MITSLLAPLAGAAGSGILTRIVLKVFTTWMNNKQRREDAINTKLTEGAGSAYVPSSLDDDGRDTANFIAHVMCYLFVFIIVMCVLFPNTEYQIFLPETINKREIDFIFFNYSWNSNLEKSVLTINSGGMVYIGLNFCIYVMTAFFNGNQNRQVKLEKQKTNKEIKVAKEERKKAVQVAKIEVKGSNASAANSRDGHESV